jgi:D-alanyl-D-alanine carboxypeptidase (penicillin-binding protein 5/6)
LVFLLVLALAFPPVLMRAPAPTAVPALSWVIFDDTFDYEIAAYRPDRRAPMASTTKLMTALVVMENTALTDTVTISRQAEGTGHKQIHVHQGDTWTVGELLEALMVVSANDAAVALAEHVGGDVASFVEMMNARAAHLDLVNTAYVNPHGLDAAGQYTTARDLVVLARAVMAHPELAALAAQDRAILVDGTGRITRWKSTNELLTAFDGAIGVKTGWTTRSGDVLVAAAERDGRRLYAVVMGSDDANVDAAALLKRGFAVFGSAERRLVPRMEDRQQARVLRAELSADALARVAHLRGLWKRQVAPWE